ncbi:GntR family transcriptional regulator [Abyssalbus ytuae]|uniref:GntR family transcriptional regulator n=1 Tax=Abyssalbus ytuae TaxID=2926907 RepID=A0A9E6ZZ02_9FLAO|nr:GntR family transcriptional regulator [Abyssalbus ytuae]UOB17782.1 GntR family transcriptional regulator [Abyssalbus ytuae]
MDIRINESSRVPKYKQIVDIIIEDIAKGKLKVRQKIPSINELSETWYLSRDTVEKAYKILKDQKIIVSVKGKGFYIAKTDLISKINVFFLINKPSSYKMMIYNSFVNTIGADGFVSLFIYHCEDTLFTRIIEKNLDAYDYYVIMPHFKDENMNHISVTESSLAAINKIPDGKLIIMDNNKLSLNKDYGTVYQSFEEDIYEALKEGVDKLQKYDKLIIIYPDKTVHPYPKRILHGFRKFCVEFDFDFEILSEIYEDMELQSKDLYVIIKEMDLVNLVRQVRKKELKLGQDIGIISYNDTPLKELLGITVISTDFKAMGETAAQMVINNTTEKIKNPFNYIERNSV